MVDIDALHSFLPELPEELKLLLFTVLFALVVAGVSTFAWISTGRAPLNYYVWLVQVVHTVPNRRVIQVFTMSDNNVMLDDGVLPDDTNSVPYEGSNHVPESNGESPSNQTTVIIIQPPSSVTINTTSSGSSNDNTGSSAQQPASPNSNTNSSSARHEFELPAEAGEDITQLHRFLRNNTDNAIATAATIALYNRRLHENTSNSQSSGTSPNSPQTSPNQVLVSRVSMSVVSEENPPSRNILISYDNLRPMSTSHNLANSNFMTDTDSGTESETSASSESENAAALTDSIAEGQPETSRTGSANPENTSTSTELKHRGNGLTIKLKFLDDTHKLAKAWLNTTVGDFKREHFSDSLNNGKVVRLIYQGQLLRDDARSLASYGIHDHCVLHCHIGNRPYAQQQGQAANQSSNNHASDGTPLMGLHGQVHGNATTFGARVISTGISWADIVLLATWNVLFYVYNWAQAVDDNNNSTIDASADPTGPTTIHVIGRRMVNNVRRALRLILNCLFDPTIRMAIVNDDDNRFNPGALVGLLFALKFTTMWMFVFYFPQFTNPTTIVLLTILTAISSLYFFVNRPQQGPIRH
ncbi:ubiquitin family domain-containing protein [Ditylenchus destructor]|uniref:Ubiquitin family domain-containing protein n=1 Tax=Ditylenchus destructor TaxID=166010 RepID=A0AAD4R895_9BILA|nr:ubiquitin family domain-containing protein [Ditylenchus destructor]